MANFNLTRDYHVPPKTEAEKKAADEAYNRAVNKMAAKGEDEGYGLIHNVYDGADVADSPNSTGAQVGGGRPVKLEDLGAELRGMDDAQKQKLLKFVGALDAALGGVKISVEQKDADGNVVQNNGDDATGNADDAAADLGAPHAGFRMGTRRELGRVTFANVFGAVFGNTHAEPVSAETNGTDDGDDHSETVDDVAEEGVVHTGLLWCCRRETYTCRTAAGVVFIIEALFRDDDPPRFANCVYADTYAEIKARANAAYEAWNKHFAVVKAHGGDEQNGTLLGIFDTWDDADRYVRAASVGGGFEQNDFDDGRADWRGIDGDSSIFVVPYTAFRVKVNMESEREYDTAEFAEALMGAKRAFSDGRDAAREYYAVDVQEGLKRDAPRFTVLDKTTGRRLQDE